MATHSDPEIIVPSPDAIKANRERILPWIVTTPVWHSHSEEIQEAVGKDTQVFFKLELWQACGSFKVRGALTSILALDKAALERGVIAASAGNHAIAVSYAAKMLGTNAIVIMPKTASHVRVEKCRHYGAEVILVDKIADAFPKMMEIAQAEGRKPIHPYEGENIVLGTATVGLEIAQQVADPDAVIAPIGGGGLSAGIALAMKQLVPTCKIFGVEPEGADAVYQSIHAGKLVTLDKVNTIADSLAVPFPMPYTFALGRRFLDDVVRVSDAEIVKAMRLLFSDMRLVAEPAAATGLAALCGPLKERLQGKRVVIVLSGTNIDLERFYNLLK